VGWGLPAVIAVLCSVLDITETFHFGYGNAAYCWISDKKVLAVAVVTPVCLSLVFNSFCLLKSTYAIRHLQQVCSITLTGDFPTGDSLAPKWVLIRN